jgi:hypothetical protein
MRVGVGMSVRMGMIVAVVLSQTVFMLLFMFMAMFVVMSANAYWRFTRQSASAVFTHQSISNEANSISRPARSSPLNLWQSGHSANISSD